MEGVYQRELVQDDGQLTFLCFVRVEVPVVNYTGRLARLDRNHADNGLSKKRCG
jgi:hypothetical protein